MSETSYIIGAESIEMTRSCARDLTNQINSTAEDLAGMLKRAHDEKAWQALGYADWKSYVAAELKFSKQRSFQLIDFATIRQELAESTIVDPEVLPTSETVTRELKTVPKDQRPAVYAEAVEAAGGKAPTAKQVKQAQGKVIEAEIVSGKEKSADGHITELYGIMADIRKCHDANVYHIEIIRILLTHAGNLTCRDLSALDEDGQMNEGVIKVSAIAGKLKEAAR